MECLSKIWNYTLKHSSSVIGCYGQGRLCWSKQLSGSCSLHFPPSFSLERQGLFEMIVLVVMSRHLDTQWPSALQFFMPTLQRDEVNWGWDIMGAIVRTKHCVIDLFTVHWLIECAASSVFHSFFFFFLSEPTLCQLKMSLYSCC